MVRVSDSSCILQSSEIFSCGTASILLCILFFDYLDFVVFASRFENFGTDVW